MDKSLGKASARKKPTNLVHGHRSMELKDPPDAVDSNMDQGPKLLKVRLYEAQKHRQSL